MGAFHLVKLTRLTPLHIGTGNENYSFMASRLQSDTLSSALAALRCLQGKSRDVKTFLESFRISSAFPFYKDSLFFPKPQGVWSQIKVVGQEEHVYRKKLKKVKYIEFCLWKQLIQGGELMLQPQQLQGDYITALQEFPRLMESQVVQRVYVPRDGMDAQPFFFSWQFFRPDAGLYCLVETDDETFSEIRDLFIGLGENGIGTDKNVGGGKFDVETGELVIPEVKQANSTLLLSLFLPAETELAELDLPRARYTLLLRGGFMAGSSEDTLRHLRKRSVYMFDSGSLFPVILPLQGKVADLTPAWSDARMHSVYRSGKPLYVSVKL